MNLSSLTPSKGSVKNKKKRIGRGQGSGKGGTATRGHKGAQSRSGYSRKLGFEGGQMPLQRRIPKFGFKNIKHKPLPMFITNRDDNSPAKFAEEVIGQFAIQKGMSETKVNEWKRQLKLAEDEGRFAYTNLPILTYAFLN